MGENDGCPLFMIAALSGCIALSDWASTGDVISQCSESVQNSYYTHLSRATVQRSPDTT